MSLCYGCMHEKVNNETRCSRCGYISDESNHDPYYPKEGTVLFNRYMIGKVLGHGGFGITYIAKDTKLDVTVAIKEYLPGEMATRLDGKCEVKTYSNEKKEQFDYGLSRFLDEAKTLAKYNQHPCIVSSLDFFEENNTAYLVMEYLEGIPLNEYLNRKGGQISLEATLEIMTPVMDALREVHKAGMIHRDISPDNIFITSGGQVKLLDFGAARFALGEKSKSLSVVLKPGYAPPEQYSSRGKQGSWTDVYSVAATIYRCIEGKKLYESVDRLLDDTLEFELTDNKKIQQVLMKALAVKSEQRTQTIDSLQQKISGAQNAEVPVQAKPVPSKKMEEQQQSKDKVEDLESKKEIEHIEEEHQELIFVPSNIKSIPGLYKEMTGSHRFMVLLSILWLIGLVLRSLDSYFFVSSAYSDLPIINSVLIGHIVIYIIFTIMYLSDIFLIFKYKFNINLSVVKWHLLFGLTVLIIPMTQMMSFGNPSIVVLFVCVIGNWLTLIIRQNGVRWSVSLLSKIGMNVAVFYWAIQAYRVEGYSLFYIQYYVAFLLLPLSLWIMMVGKLMESSRQKTYKVLYILSFALFMLCFNMIASIFI